MMKINSSPPHASPKALETLKSALSMSDDFIARAFPLFPTYTIEASADDAHIEVKAHQHAELSAFLARARKINKSLGKIFLGIDAFLFCRPRKNTAGTSKINIFPISFFLLSSLPAEILIFLLSSLLCFLCPCIDAMMWSDECRRTHHDTHKCQFKM